MKWLLLFLALPAQASIQERLEWLLNTPLTGLPKYESASPPTLASAELGEKLFYDKRLSADDTVSCSSCHEAGHAYSSGGSVATGIGGAKGTRKPPPILNKAFANVFFWDGRASSLEEQAQGPLFHPDEMGMTEAALVAKLNGIEEYRKLFAAEITLEAVTKAIGDFERTLLSGDSLWDRWQANPLGVSYPKEAERGYELFLDRDCVFCHTPPFFTDQQFHNTGMGYHNGAFKDEGRFTISKVESEKGAFKTPTLRDVSRHAPYMHDGTLATLAAVVEFYNDGGIENPNVDPKITRLGLQPDERAALVAFLMTLDGRHYSSSPAEGAVTHVQSTKVTAAGSLVMTEALEIPSNPITRSQARSVVSFRKSR